MVVDDDRMTVELIKHKLLDKGYEVVTASDGEEAMALLKQKAPDMIILDVQMPNMNGYTFIMEKNKIEACAGVPVVVLTSQKETRPLFQRHGARAYLIKPLNTQELLDKVAEIVGP